MPERPQLAVVDSTPIIALALVGRLDLLQRLYGQVVIPPAVQREVLAGEPGAAGSAELQQAN
jgi:predicted nucleic acid-binding protein